MNRWFISVVIAFTAIFLAPSSLAHLSSKPHIHAVPGLNTKVVRVAMNAHRWAVKTGRVKNKNILTIVDYTKPASQKRLWVVNLRTGKVLMHTFVAHGVNSGSLRSTRFSNRVNSRQTSLGVFTTARVYYGKHGRSMRLHGLQKGVNHNAWRRAIVVHPAWYATATYRAQKGKVGNSWGCLALDPQVSKRFIRLTKGGSVIFSYGNSTKLHQFASKNWGNDLFD